jgi:23S rRNA (guanosine2251-2'-O)-methyltransferase
MATAITHPDNDPNAGEESSGEVICFYQCSSPECNLRFPAPVKIGMVCPFCRSDIIQIRATEIYQLRQNFQPSQGPGLSVLLDNLRSAYNVGSILRTSDGAGIQHAYLGGITPTPAHPRLAKTALSAEIHTSWSHHANAVELVQSLRQSGNSIIGLETTVNATNLFDESIKRTDKSVLVVGNEICGIDPGILEQCDAIIALPMLGKKNSLNVSVSFGIAAYHLLFEKSGILPLQSENK